MHDYGIPGRHRGTPEGPVTPEVPRPRKGWFKPLPDDLPEDDPDDSPEVVDEVLAVTAEAFLRKTKAKRTRDAYVNDFKHFRAWCDKTNRTALPATAETVKFYLAAHGVQVPGKGGLAIATLVRRLVGIAHAHKMANLESPTKATIVRDMLAGIRREAKDQGYGKQNKATPILIEDLRKVLAKIDTTTLIGKRDKALILMEWCGAFRSGEICTVHVNDMTEHEEGIVIELRYSKTDQFGEGDQIGILYGANPATCPVVALKDWLAASGIAEGPIIRYVNRHGKVGSDNGLARQNISKIFRKLYVAAGLDPKGIRGHSARAGSATEMMKKGMSEAEAMAHGRWKDPRVFRGYVRVQNAFKTSPVRLVGL